MSATSPAQLPQMFHKAIAEGDLESAMALFEPEAVLSSPQGDIAGVEAIARVMTPVAAAKADIRIRTLRSVRAGDVTLNYNAVVSAGQAEGRAVEVCRRQGDGTWRYVMVFHPGE